MSEKMQQMNIGFEDTTPIVCDECGHSIFESGFLLRRVSALYTGGDEAVMPVAGR
jgi:hypothetical protein